MTHGDVALAGGDAEGLGGADVDRVELGGVAPALLDDRLRGLVAGDAEFARQGPVDLAQRALQIDEAVDADGFAGEHRYGVGSVVVYTAVKSLSVSGR